MVRYLSFTILLLASLSLFAEAESRQTITLADFGSKDVSLELFQGALRGQKLLRPEKELEIQWENSGIRYWEWYLHKLPELPRYTKLKVSIPVKREEGSASINKFNLRLVDFNNETFQYPCVVKWGEENEITLIWELTPETKPSGSWGGKKDGVLDFPVRFIGASGEYSDATGSVKIGPVTAEVTTVVPLARSVVLELEGTGAVNIVRPGETFQAFLRNTTHVPVTVKAEFRVSTLDGKKLAASTPSLIRLEPGKHHQLNLPELESNGVYHLSCTVSDPDNPADQAVHSRRVAVMTPAGPTPGRSEGFLFGICSHPNWTRDREIHRKEAEAMGLIGAKVLRVDMAWWHIEERKGQVDYTRYDQLLETFSAQGIEFEAVLHQVPGWAETKGNLPDHDAWRSFLRRTFLRYQDQIRFWEIWNEPDLTSFATFTAPEYAELMKIAREEARAAVPGALLLTGGFATMGDHGAKKANFQEDTLRLGKGYYDIHAYHEHANFKEFARMIDERFLPMRRQLGVSEPWYANETAISSAHISEKEQAITLVQKLIFAWGRGAIGYNWYNLRNKGDNPKEPEHNYGMITSDFQPKAVYVAYNTLTTLLGKGEFVEEIPVSGGMLFQFRNGKDTILCGWSSDDSGEQLLIRSGVEPGKVIDWAGNSAPAQKLGEYTVLQLLPEPHFWHFPATEQIEVQIPPVRLLSPPIAVPGRSMEFAIELSSPVNRPLTIEMTFSASAGIQGPPPQTVSLSPGEKRVWKGSVKTDPAISSAFQNSYLTVDYRIPQLNYSDRIKRTLPIAQAISAALSGKPADFLLNEYRQVVSLFDADPGNSHLLWSGPADLSAEIRLGATETELLIAVSVTDDIHSQPYRGTNVWRGDNLQLALNFPDQKGMWELGLSLLDSGKTECVSWNAPNGLSGEACTATVKLTAERKGTKTEYRAAIPLKSLGIDRDTLRNGFRFNLLVNDNDGEARKGWMNVAPGIGERKDSSFYPFVLIP